MSRYHAFFIGFMLATLFVIGWLFFAAIDYGNVSWNCADRTADWETCARPIHLRIIIQSVAVLTLWSIGLWLLIRERKKQ